jgi:hypothetical protein
MALSLRDIAQEHCRRVGLPVPNSVVSNADANILQIFGLLQELLEDLVKRKAYQQVTREATWVSTATEDQGSIDTLAPSGFVSVLPGTFYNRSTNLEVSFGMTPEEWQSRKASSGTTAIGPWARLRNNRLLFSPIPTAGQTFAFEYRSSWFVQSATAVPLARWTGDTDTCILPDFIPLSWIGWRWKEEKGLDYAEAFRHYEELLASLAMRDGGPRPIDMAGERPGAGASMPVGSWPL